jgi:hypothetical protein
MNTVDSGLVFSEWCTNFFIAVPPHWCKLIRTLEVMPGNVNWSFFVFWNAAYGFIRSYSLVGESVTMGS